VVRCPMCKHGGMVIRKDVLKCEWCGHTQKQPKEDYEQPSIREILE
jgi:hypothetical protein